MVLPGAERLCQASSYVTQLTGIARAREPKHFRALPEELISSRYVEHAGMSFSSHAGLYLCMQTSNNCINAARANKTGRKKKREREIQQVDAVAANQMEIIYTQAEQMKWHKWKEIALRPKLTSWDRHQFVMQGTGPRLYCPARKLLSFSKGTNPIAGAIKTLCVKCHNPKSLCTNWRERSKLINLATFEPLAFRLSRATI